MIGIYQIRNIINGKRYIGQSKHIEHRFSTHRTELNAKRHINPHLQFAWQKYGEQNFAFEFLLICQEEELDKKEQEMIIKFQTLNPKYGYNVREAGSNGSFKHTEEQILKMRQACHPRPVLQFNEELQLLNCFEGGVSHIYKVLGYTRECVKRCCEQMGHQIYKNCFWVYKDVYELENFTWNNYWNKAIQLPLWQNSPNYKQRKIAQYTLDRKLIKIWNSLKEITEAGYIHSQVSNICNHKGKKTHRGYIWTYEDYDWKDGYFDNLDTRYEESILNRCKSVVRISRDGKETITYKSVKEAGKINGIGDSNISCAITKHGISGGYFWAKADNIWTNDYTVEELQDLFFKRINPRSKKIQQIKDGVPIAIFNQRKEIIDAQIISEWKLNRALTSGIEVDGCQWRYI